MLGKSNILILSELLPDLVDFTLLPIFLDHVFTGGSLRASVCVSLRDALETNNSQTTQTKRRETDTETCGPSQTWLASYKFVWSIWLSPFGAALTCSRPLQVCKQHSLYWLFFIFMTSFANSFAYLMSFISRKWSQISMESTFCAQKAILGLWFRTIIINILKDWKPSLLASSHNSS